MLKTLSPQPDNTSEPSMRPNVTKGSDVSSFSRLLKSRSLSSDEIASPPEAKASVVAGIKRKPNKTEAEALYSTPALIQPTTRSLPQPPALMGSSQAPEATASGGEGLNSETKVSRTTDGPQPALGDSGSPDEPEPNNGMPTASRTEKAEATAAQKAEEFVQKNAQTDPEPGDLIRRVMESADPRSAAFLASVRFAGLKADQRAHLLDKLKAESVSDFKASIDLGLSGTNALGNLRMDAVSQKAAAARAGLPQEFLNNIKFALNRNLDTITMKVAPEGVGALTIKIDQAAGLFNVNIQAKDAATASQIQSSISDMRAMFEQKGLLLGDVLVSSDPYSREAFGGGSHQDEQRENTADHEGVPVNAQPNEDLSVASDNVISKA